MQRTQDPRAIFSLGRGSDGGLTWAVPDAWQQGRGAYGGLVTAALVRALDTVAQGRPLRSLMATLCGPALVGLADLHVDALRQGSKLSAGAVTMRQGGEVVAHGVGVYGEARADRTEWRAHAPPDLRPWTGGLSMPEGASPTFTRHFEYQPEVGFPQTGEAPFTEGWVRLRGASGPVDAALLTALIDAWWPAAFVAMAETRPMGTIATTIDLLPTPPDLDASRPTWLRVRLLAGAEGHLVESRELFSESGQLLAINHQTQALIR